MREGVNKLTAKLACHLYTFIPKLLKGNPVNNKLYNKQSLVCGIIR